MFDVCRERGLVLVELADGVSLEDVRAATGTPFEVYTGLVYLSLSVSVMSVSLSVCLSVCVYLSLYVMCLAYVQVSPALKPMGQVQ